MFYYTANVHYIHLALPSMYTTRWRKVDFMVFWLKIIGHKSIFQRKHFLIKKILLIITIINIITVTAQCHMMQCADTIVLYT